MVFLSKFEDEPGFLLTGAMVTVADGWVGWLAVQVSYTPGEWVELMVFKGQSMQCEGRAS